MGKFISGFDIKMLLTITVCATACAVIGHYALARGASAPVAKEPQNIAYDFLDLEKPFGSNKSHYACVDGLIKKAAARIPPAQSYTKERGIAALQTIDSLLKEEGFVFKNNLLICRGIDAKTIDCDNYSALYVAIAEALKLPIVPVYAPNHSFVRLYCDDGTYLDWESTQSRAVTDDYYVREMKIPESSIRKGVYMKTLSRREFIGVEYNNIGAYLMTGKRFSDAVPYLTMAITFYPKFSSAYHNRGTAYYATRRMDAALRDLLAACELDPIRPETYNTMGDVYFDMKNYDKAVEQYRAAISLDPANSVPYYSIGLVMKAQGNEAGSRRWIERSKAIRGRYGR